MNKACVVGFLVVALLVTAVYANPVHYECSNPAPEWIWCDDFETDRLSGYFEYVNHGGLFTRVEGVGVLESTGMRTTFQEGDVSAGNLKLAFGRTPSAYMRPVDEGTQN